ncbi:lipoxygenase family protein [Tsukamurella strandjordii]
MSVNRRSAFKVAFIAGGVVAAQPLLSAIPDASAEPSSQWIPRLTADCSPDQLATRARLLAEARQTYRWSTTIENVVGVPMSADLPLGENPTIDWLIEFIDNFLNLVENLVDSVVIAVLPQLKSETLACSVQIRALKNQFAGIARAVDALSKKYLSATLDTVVDATDKAVVGTWVTALLGILSALQAIRRTVFGAVERSLVGQKLWIGDIGDKGNLQRYNAMWGSIPLPSVAERLRDDDFFGHTRLAGPNPMIIEKVSERLPRSAKIDDAKFAAATGESLRVALAEGRLFLCDYRPLGRMAKEDATYKLLTGPNWNTAPIAIFLRPRGSRQLKPAAIQVGQVPGESPVFYAATRTSTSSDYWGWQMAKTIVQTADFNHHEMFSHLARTHLISEAFCVAAHRQLPPGHPLHTLLIPHFEGDLFINNLAASIIMGPETFGDLILASDISDTQSTAGKARLDWNFTDSIPERDLASRGMDDPDIDFPYRDDARLIWSAIERWVHDYVWVYYRDDAAVAADADLGRWLAEARDQGKIAGIPPVRNRKSLVEVITMIIFTASAQHAAVNYLQRDEMSYAPHYSGTLAALPVKKKRNYTERDWFDMMPTFLTALAQMYFFNLLGTVYYRRLGDYRTNVFPHPEALVDPRIRGPLKDFKSNLAKAEAVITTRNSRRKWPYPYLMPSNIPMSTNI